RSWQQRRACYHTRMAPSCRRRRSKPAAQRGEAAMIKDALEGKPLRHPLHPFLVHFPIGLFTLSLILHLISLRYPLDGLYRGAFYAIALGVICSLVAAVPGFADFFDILKDHPAKPKARLHMILNLIMVAIFAVNA